MKLYHLLENRTGSHNVNSTKWDLERQISNIFSHMNGLDLKYIWHECKRGLFGEANQPGDGVGKERVMGKWKRSKCIIRMEVSKWNTFVKLIYPNENWKVQI
jgi:hypothetical protein